MSKTDRKSVATSKSGVTEVSINSSDGSDFKPPKLRIFNVVAKCNLGCNLELRRMNLRLRNTIFNPKEFASRMTLQMWVPKVTVHVFGNGSLNVVGAPSIRAAKLAMKKMERIAQRLRYQAEMTHFRVDEVSATANIGHRINLNQLALEHDEFVKYNTELGSGLTYKLPLGTGVVAHVTIYSTGTFVVRRAKSVATLEHAYRGILPVLREYSETAHRTAPSALVRSSVAHGSRASSVHGDDDDDDAAFDDGEEIDFDDVLGDDDD